MDYQTKLNTYLDAFAKYESHFPGPIPDSITFHFNKHSGHIVFGSIIHGNEVGSLPAVLNIIESLATKRIKYGGTVSFFLGNKKAALQKIRFTEYDLNRSFGEATTTNSSYERNRAMEIMKLLKQSQVFFDFHQTNRPSRFPFYIFSMHKESYHWAQAAGVAPAFVTRKPGQRFSDSGMCSDEYMRSLNKAGITLELGEQGFHKEAENITKTIILRSLKNMDKVANHTASIEKLACKNNLFEFYATTYREPVGNGKKALKEGLCNFDEVYVDEELGKEEEKRPLLCPKNGYILFPKYPTLSQKSLPSGELFVIAEKLHFHPIYWVN